MIHPSPRGDDGTHYRAELMTGVDKGQSSPGAGKAAEACEKSGIDSEVHFAHIRKMVGIGSGASREVLYSTSMPDALRDGQDTLQRRQERREKWRSENSLLVFRTLKD